MSAFDVKLCEEQPEGISEFIVAERVRIIGGFGGFEGLHEVEQFVIFGECRRYDSQGVLRNGREL